MKSWRMEMSKLINQYCQLSKLPKSSKALRSYSKTLLLMKSPEFLKKQRDSPFMKMKKISLKLLKSLIICKKAWQLKIIRIKSMQMQTLKKIICKSLKQFKLKNLLSRISKFLEIILKKFRQFWTNKIVFSQLQAKKELMTKSAHLILLFKRKIINKILNQKNKMSWMTIFKSPQS